MAKTLIDTCDPCKEDLGITDMAAERSVYLAVDGGPVKRFEVCPQHLYMLKPVLDMYERCGVDESLKPKKRSSSKKPEEAEGSPWFNPPEPDQPRQLEWASPESPEQPTKEKPGKEKSEDQILVTCSLPHSTGKPATVQYRGRNTHAKEAHDGLKAWDIEWGDPAGVLTHVCETHEQCKKVGLAFPSATSLSRHIRMCPLEKLPEAA